MLDACLPPQNRPVHVAPPRVRIGEAGRAQRKARLPVLAGSCNKRLPHNPAAVIVCPVDSLEYGTLERIDMEVLASQQTAGDRQAFNPLDVTLHAG